MISFYCTLQIISSLLAYGMADKKIPNFVADQTAIKDTIPVCSSEESRQHMMDCAWNAPNFRNCMYQCAKPVMGMPHLTAETMCESIPKRIEVINCMSLCVPVDSVERKKEITGFHECLGFPLFAFQVDNFVSALIDYKRRHNIE